MSTHWASTVVRIGSPLGNQLKDVDQYCLEPKLSTSPMSSLGVVFDSVTSLHSDPLRNRPVLFLLATQALLQLETFDGTLKKTNNKIDYSNQAHSMMIWIAIDRST